MVGNCQIATIASPDVWAVTETSPAAAKAGFVVVVVAIAVSAELICRLQVRPFPPAKQNPVILR